MQWAWFELFVSLDDSRKEILQNKKKGKKINLGKELQRNRCVFHSVFQLSLKHFQRNSPLCIEQLPQTYDARSCSSTVLSFNKGFSYSFFFMCHLNTRCFMILVPQLSRIVCLNLMQLYFWLILHLFKRSFRQLTAITEHGTDYQYFPFPDNMQ